MREVNPAELPYQWPQGIDPIASVGRVKTLRQVQFPNALAAGASLITTGTELPKEGVLALYQEAFVVFFDDGGQRSGAYSDLSSYKVRKMRWPPFGRGLDMKKLTLAMTNGPKMHIRIGPEMAANATFILTAKEVRSE
jgi:hypothetical protein